MPGRGDCPSYTEFECDVAGRAGLPRLVFLLDETTATVPLALADVDRSRVTRFRRRLQDKQVTVVVANPDDLATQVGEGLATLTRAHKRSRPEPHGPWMALPLDDIVERPELGNRLVDIPTMPGIPEVGLTTALHEAGGFGNREDDAGSLGLPPARGPPPFPGRATVSNHRPGGSRRRPRRKDQRSDDHALREPAGDP
jgi:hypothetical protein